MAQLQSTNVVGTLCVNGVAVGGGKDFKFCCFTTSTTWTPSSDLVDGDGFIDTTIVGGGGGGGGAASCTRMCNQGQNTRSVAHSTTAKAGGGGTVLTKGIVIDSTDACTVTIGAGGPGGYLSGSDYGNIASMISDLAVDGGNSVFGGWTALGGGGGSNCLSGRYCLYTNMSCVDQCEVPASSRPSQTTGLGDGVVKPSGGESGEIWARSTGSIPFLYNSCGFCIVTSNQDVFGAAGGDNGIGGHPTFVTNSVCTTGPAGVIFCANSCKTTEGGANNGGTVVFEAQDGAYTASQHDSKFYGAGGVGGRAGGQVTGVNTSHVVTLSNLRGATGADGIVVLKWME